MMQWLFILALIYFVTRLFGGNVAQRQKRNWQKRDNSPSPIDFELNLLSLSSLVIKADGTVTQRELDYVRLYFVRAYGKERANAVFRMFNQAIKNQEISAQRIGLLFQLKASYEVRLQVIHFLFGIAKADGAVSSSEVEKIQEIANYMNIGANDFSSIKAQFFKEADTAYKILGIEKNASIAQIKKAYRSMAKKYHPDKVAQLGETHQKMATEKFKKVQEAYEQIQRQRGF